MTPPERRTTSRWPCCECPEEIESAIECKSERAYHSELNLSKANELRATNLHDRVTRIVLVRSEGKLLQLLRKDDCLVEEGLHVTSHETERLVDVLKFGPDVEYVLFWKGREDGRRKKTPKRETQREGGVWDVRLMGIRK